MPAITVTMGTLESLGVALADLQGSVLTGHAKRRLEALLTAHGFELASDIRLVVLATGEGIVLAQ